MHGDTLKNDLWLFIDMNRGLTEVSYKRFDHSFIVCVISTSTLEMIKMEFYGHNWIN